MIVGGGWLPLFADGGGDFYFVDLNCRPVSPVHHFRLEEVDHPVEFESLEKMITTLARAFADGMVFVHPKGYIGMDYERFAGLAAEVNPLVEWWK